MLVDLHTHCEYSPDSQTPLSEMLETARARGVDVYAVTDHVELHHPWQEECLTKTLPASYAAVTAAQKDAPLRLLRGIELAQPLQEPALAEGILREYEFDLVIGSVHCPEGYPDFYDMDFPNLTDADIHERLQVYYDELLRMVEWGKFDTLAHITYPYRYLNEARRMREIAVYPEQFDAAADRVFSALAERGMALELNLRSIARTPEDAALNARYFRRFRELGGERVTVGSDAHVPQDIAIQIERGYALLRNAGFREVTWYEQRHPVTAPLEEPAGRPLR